LDELKARRNNLLVLEFLLVNLILVASPRRPSFVRIDFHNINGIILYYALLAQLASNLRFSSASGYPMKTQINIKMEGAYHNRYHESGRARRVRLMICRRQIIKHHARLISEGKTQFASAARSASLPF
jgi:hypothetical protein